MSDPRDAEIARLRAQVSALLAPPADPLLSGWVERGSGSALRCWCPVVPDGRDVDDVIAGWVYLTDGSWRWLVRSRDRAREQRGYVRTREEAIARADRWIAAFVAGVENPWTLPTTIREVRICLNAPNAHTRYEPGMGWGLALGDGSFMFGRFATEEEVLVAALAPAPVRVTGLASPEKENSDG